MGFRDFQIWTLFSFIILFPMPFSETKADCLEPNCDSDPSMVTNLQLSIRYKDRKPFVEAQWNSAPNSDFTESNRYRLMYRIIQPKISNYSIHEMKESFFSTDLHNKPEAVSYEFQVSKFYKGDFGKPLVKIISIPGAETDSTNDNQSPTILFDSPETPRITELDANSILVTWQPLKPRNHNEIILFYQVRYYAEKYEEKTEKLINVTTTNVTLSNLPYSDYKVFVRAVTKTAASIWSNPSYYFKMIGQNLDLPVPIYVKAYRESKSELEIKWSLPNISDKDKDLNSIAGFIVLYAPISQNPEWQKHFPAKKNMKTVIKGLQPSINYQVKVASVNAQGLNGTFSETVRETTNIIPQLNSQTVRKLRCSVVNSKMLKLEWTSPMRTAGIKKYEIFYSARLNYISAMNLKKSEFINEIRKFVDHEANVLEYNTKLENLQSNADYTIKVRPLYNDAIKEDSYQSFLETLCKTRPSLPDEVHPPVPLHENSNQLKLKLFRCSERSGPLFNYTVVVGAYKSDKGVEFAELKEPDDYSLMELGTNSKVKEYIGPYIAMSRNVNSLFLDSGRNSTEVPLGKENTEYDLGTNVVNKRLDSSVYYKVFMRVCMEQEDVHYQCKSSAWSNDFNIANLMSSLKSNKREPSNDNGDMRYTIVLTALLLCGVVLAISCIVIGCIIKRRKWKKRLLNIGNNANSNHNHRDSVRSSILLKTSLTNGLRDPGKSLLSSDSKKFTVAPDLVTVDSVLMCQDGSKLSPVLLNKIHLQRSEVNGKDFPDKPSTPVTNLYQYISDLKANDGALLQSEFETLNTNLDDRFSWKRSNVDSNKCKNRYANVVAYDHTSVVLQPLEDVIGSDYINANFIDGYQKKNAYIATQGPLPDTTDDFWRMVWEQKSTSIVMMTRLEERSGVKCHQYWPNRGFICYGQMIVCHMESFSFSYYTIRVFELRCNRSQDKREIHHFQFTAWPDHGVPKLSTPLLMFIRRYRSMAKIDSGPTVVHCSAGVGRTGAFIVIEAQLERIKHEKNVSVFNYVSKIRCQRNYMVQTQAQYMFILETLLEAVEDGNTEVLACNLHSHVSKLSQIGLSGANELSGFELEFSKLNNLASNRDRHGMMLADFVKAAGNQPVNLTKNKIRNIIPYDWNRVVLPAIRGIDGSDYINASYIDGYRDRRAYIAAQSPLPSSVEDFWRMIWDQHSGVVVVLNQPQEEKCHIYWPAHKSIRYQFFVVDPVVEYNMPNYILREFKVTDARDGEFRTLRQFQFTQWPSHGCPKESDSILDFIRQVHKTKEQFGHMEPMVVHCSTGSGRTGVFIALSIVIDRLQQESVVDMYQTVKLLHKQRVGLVQTEEQYEFVYKAVVDYLTYYEKNDKNSVY